MKFITLSAHYRQSVNKDAVIIHLFALLHAAVALACRMAGIIDDLVLTILTMLMVVIICWRQGMGVKFLAVSIVLVNVFGFIIGTGWARIFALFSADPLVIHPLSTFLTTELLGWITYVVSLRVGWKNGRSRRPVSVQWILVAFVAIMATRLMVIFLTPGGVAVENTLTNVIVDYVFSFMCFVILAVFAMRMNAKTIEQQHLAQFRYMKLKQQVNPHFLFNSLNILDCLVTENQQEQASTYIHKLAGLYRYNLKNEEERTVKLRDEMNYAEQYVDLLKVRFPDGLQVSIDIPEEALSRQVVPCSVQLLIENAIKHNAVSASEPLKVDVSLVGDMLVVSNDIHPKKTESSSTGLGLKYIRQQYEDLAGRSVVVQQDEKHYSVQLPII